MKDRKFEGAVLPITASVAAALLVSGCGPSTSTANTDIAICRDSTGRRIADARCRAGGGGHAYFLARGTRVPAIGEAVSGGSANPRAGVSYARASAATVSRGGFAMSARAGG